jgi:hypothetical protein
MEVESLDVDLVVALRQGAPLREIEESMPAEAAVLALPQSGDAGILVSRQPKVPRRVEGCGRELVSYIPSPGLRVDT